MKENAERTAHAAFEDLAQQIWDQHRVRVDSVSFRWNHVPTQTEDYHDVRSVAMDSVSYRIER